MNHRGKDGVSVKVKLSKDFTSLFILNNEIHPAASQHESNLIDTLLPTSASLFSFPGAFHSVSDEKFYHPALPFFSFHKELNNSAGLTAENRGASFQPEGASPEFSQGSFQPEEVVAEYSERSFQPEEVVAERSGWFFQPEWTVAERSGWFFQPEGTAAECSGGFFQPEGAVAECSEWVFHLITNHLNKNLPCLKRRHYFTFCKN